MNIMKAVLKNVPLENVFPDPQQPRRVFGQAKLESLAESIKENGLIQPIGVFSFGNGNYQIIHGERRWRAHQLLGLKMITAVVTGVDDEETTLRLKQFVENHERADLNVIEQALFYRDMLATGMPEIELARKVGKKGNTTHIKHTLLWLEVEEAIQTLAAEGRLPKDVKAINALLSVPAGEVRIKLAQSLAETGASIKAIVQACEKVVRRLEIKTDKLEGAPSLALALNGRSQNGNGRVNWKNVRDASRAMCGACSLSELVSVEEPAWHLITEAAEATCKACDLRNLRDLEMCRQCPGVEIVRRLANMVGATAVIPEVAHGN